MYNGKLGTELKHEDGQDIRLTNITLVVSAPRSQAQHHVADVKDQLEQGFDQTLGALHAPYEELLGSQGHV